MRAQLRDHSDIVGSLVMAPPVEKLLRSKEESNPEKLFNAPIGRIHVGLHVSHFCFRFFSICLSNNLAKMFHCQLPNRLASMCHISSRRSQR